MPSTVCMLDWRQAYKGALAIAGIVVGEDRSICVLSMVIFEQCIDSTKCITSALLAILVAAKLGLDTAVVLVCTDWEEVADLDAAVWSEVEHGNLGVVEGERDCSACFRVHCMAQDTDGFLGWVEDCMRQAGFVAVGIIVGNLRVGAIEESDVVTFFWGGTDGLTIIHVLVDFEDVLQSRVLHLSLLWLIRHNGRWDCLSLRGENSSNFSGKRIGDVYGFGVSLLL